MGKCLYEVINGHIAATGIISLLPRAAFGMDKQERIIHYLFHTLGREACNLAKDILHVAVVGFCLAAILSPKSFHKQSQIHVAKVLIGAAFFFPFRQCKEVPCVGKNIVYVCFLPFRG